MGGELLICWNSICSSMSLMRFLSCAFVMMRIRGVDSVAVDEGLEVLEISQNRFNFQGKLMINIYFEEKLVKS